MLQLLGLNTRQETGQPITAMVMALALIMALSGTSVWANPVTEEQVTGVAYANSPGQARQMALAQIVYQVNQKLGYNRCQRSIAKTQATDCTSLAYYFDFPLDGVRYTDLPSETGSFAQQATLSREAVASQFKDQLPRLKQTVVTALSQEEHSPESLQAVWEARDALVAYSEILALFGVQTDVSLDNSQLQALEALESKSAQTITDLNQLSDPVLVLGDVKNAFIHAPVPEGSVEMTPFSELVRRTLSQQLADRFPQAEIKVRGIESRGLVRTQQCHDPVRNLEKKCVTGTEVTQIENSSGTDSLLLGKYTQKADSVLLQYKLLDTSTGQARTTFIRIPNALLEGIRTAPIHQAFDQELHKTILADDQFHVQLGSSRGNRNILIYEKEKISLKLRTSQAAWFYLVGHVIREDKQYSYLVELDPRNGTFVSRIEAEQAEQWVEIGEFTVEPPLGVEHIQLVAASYDLSNSLPPTRWDEKLGYHVIKGSEEDALAGLQTVRGLQRVCSTATTRGLQRNCSSQAKIETDEEISEDNEIPLREHESVLSYTSLPLKSAASPGQ